MHMDGVSSGVAPQASASTPSNGANGNQKTTATQGLSNGERTQAKEGSVPDFRGTKHRVKIEGQEREVDYDELIADYQLKQASHKRLQEASSKEKQAQQVLKALEEGDISYVTQKVGKAKAKELFENFLIEQMEYEQLSPAEKRAIELEREAEALKREKAERENADKEKEKVALMEKAHRELDLEVGEALKELGRKPTPRLVIRVIDEMIARMDAKGQAVTAKDATKYAQKGILEDIREYLPQLNSQELREILGKDILRKLNEEDVSRVMDDASRRRVKPQGQREPEPKKKLSTDDWFKEREKRFGKR
jgi:hypothetical protein